jgi:endonuclease/exonuclease/phosphatase (EEP) superfamily protein YafD
VSGAAIGVLIAVVCDVLAFVGLISRTAESRRQPMIVLATVSGFLLPWAIPALAIGAVEGNWWLVAAAACVLPSLLARNRPRRAPTTTEGPALRLLTANLLYRSTESPRALAALAAEHQVDVVMVQELTEHGLAGLRAGGLDDQLGHSFVRTGHGGEGTGIFSRYPLIDTESLPGFGFEALAARIEVPGGGRVELRAVHLEPPWPRPPAAWSAELPRLAEVMRSIPPEHGSVIVAGDFNATIDHAGYRRLVRSDYHEAGGRPRRTWPAHRPWPALIGIDHVLLRSASAIATRAVPVRGSDHHGLLVDLRLPSLVAHTSPSTSD